MHKSANVTYLLTLHVSIFIDQSKNGMLAAHKMLTLFIMATSLLDAGASLTRQ